jgi:hypothetical protein
MGDIEDVIRFGSEISWYTSLVPAHVTDYAHPKGFRTFDQRLKFRTDEYERADYVIEKVRAMKDEGFLLYDSDQYLDDIKRFIRDEETITWRSHNDNVCDSPNLYFALLPNGEFSPCCDHRLENSYPAYASNFPKIYKDKTWRKEVYDVTSSCGGCMYGSYPEMTISMRYMAAKLQRLRTFITSPPQKKWPLTYEELLEKANKIACEKRDRVISRDNELQLLDL